MYDNILDDIKKEMKKERHRKMIFENNVKLAKKYMVESIYRSANIEGIGMTFPETQTICDGMSVSGHNIDEINAINDLKNAWRWYFDNPKVNIDVKSLKTLNAILGKYTVINAGTIRDKWDTPIRVPLRDGKNFFPPVPESEDAINNELDKLKNNPDKLDAALNIFCFVAKGQFFNDGNKRTATIFANMYMIQMGQGILSIPIDKKLEFYNALTSFYEDDNNKDILKTFLKTYCITV